MDDFLKSKGFVWLAMAVATMFTIVSVLILKIEISFIAAVFFGIIIFGVLEVTGKEYERKSILAYLATALLVSFICHLLTLL